MQTNRAWRIIAFIIVLTIAFGPISLIYSRPTNILTGNLSLRSHIDSLVQKYNADKIHLALKVVALPENQVMYSRNQDDPMIIASNTKLFSTAAALCKLTPDFKFTTSLSYDGNITNNVLNGNLVVRSNGDPNISGRFHANRPTAVFEKWSSALAGLGIKQVNGNIIIDDSAFDREFCPPAWPKDQLNFWYCAPVAAVSFNDNCVYLSVFANSRGGIGYSLNPPTRYVNVNLDVSIDRKISRNQISFTRAEGTNDITVRGKLAPRAGAAGDYITIHNPPMFFGTVLAETLAGNGIGIKGNIQSVNNVYKPDSKLVRICEEQSGLLPTISVVNKNSHNFYAEQVMRAMAYSSGGKGSAEKGTEIISDFLTDEVGVKNDNFAIYDGCGLTRGNRFSTNHIVGLLTYLYGNKYFQPYRDSLNTEKWNLRGGRPEIWAKSGYLTNALAVSGYALRKNTSNSYYAFSLLVNDYQGVRNGFTNARAFRNDFIKLMREQ